MDATSIIKKAIQKPILTPTLSSLPEKKEHPKNDLFVLDSDKNDMIMKNARRLDRKFKKKKTPISKWTNTDFLNFIEKSLSPHQVKIEYQNKSYDRSMIDDLYDYLADIFSYNMSPQVLKDYIEWWCGCYAFKFRGQEIAVLKFKNYKHLDKFVFEHSDLVKTEEGFDDTVEIEENLSDIYSLGGVPSLLMSTGIVDTYRWLVSQKISDPKGKVVGNLGSFAPNILQDIYNRTVKRSPYQGEPLDFVSMLRSHVSEIDSVDFKQYFV